MITTDYSYSLTSFCPPASSVSLARHTDKDLPDSFCKQSIYIKNPRNNNSIMLLNGEVSFNVFLCKELFHMTDTYVIDVQDPGNALGALMFVLAIDAEKCSRN